LGLQTTTSDFDVICCCPDLVRFERALGTAMIELGLPSPCPRRVELSPEASVTDFAYDGLAIELFCQAIPVYQQHGFRHMLIEGRLLRLASQQLRERVLALREAGLKTEPAFAKVLGLDGDPYGALLDLESQSQPQLLDILTRAGLAPSSTE
jgi:hypothetical protein